MERSVRCRQANELEALITYVRFDVREYVWYPFEIVYMILHNYSHAPHYAPYYFITTYLSTQY